MANVTVSVAPIDVPDTLAALEQQFRAQAINTFFSGNPAGYEALTDAQKGKALLAVFLRIITRNYRRTQAEQAVIVADPDVT